jgi:hypothetical protein
MVEVVTDEISLSDERTIRAIVQRLGLPHLSPDWITVVSFGRPLEQFAYWERYLVDRNTKFVWRGKRDVWLTPHEKEGTLHRVVIEGLQSRQDAEALRSEVWKYRHSTKERLTPDVIHRIAEKVAASRPLRLYQATFRHALSKVRHYFKWEDGEVVEADGWLLPVSKLKLSDHDVETLRRVYAALPPTIFGPDGQDPSSVNINDAPCPLCGGVNKTKTEEPKPLQERRTARKEVEDRREVSDKAFMAWVNERLMDEDKPGTWTLTGTLYDDYFSWTCTYDKEGERTVGEYAEQKAAVLSKTAWGTLMGRMFAKRKDGKKGYWYNVRLRKVRKRAA